MINRIKGTQDFLDLTLFNFLLDQVKKHLELYNFTQIDTPILEPLELFKRSLGTETDVVTKEMYTVNTGSDEESICLRPEATASVVRAFVNNGVQQIPWKVFLCGSMFRHERPQKGRYREFHQVNIEVIGSSSIYQDVQLIKMLDRFFYEVLTLDTYGLHINFLGCHADRDAYKKELYAYVSTVAERLCPTCQIRKEKNILRMFDCKSDECKALLKDAPKIADYLCKECAKEWQDLKDNLENLSVSYSYSPTLVRGLDYYEKTVFEFVSTELGAQNAFCGGGRYNQLAQIIGAKEDQPSVGAAIGIERVLLMLERIKDKLPLPQLLALHVIIPVTPDQQPLALLLADELQAKKLCTEVLLEGESIRSMMRKANKLSAKYALILGPEEQLEKTVTIKNMMTGTELKKAQNELVDFLKS